MNKEERRILRAVTEHSHGLLSPADLINGIAKQNRKPIENLVSRGYLEEVPQSMPTLQGGQKILNFYRASEKGLLVFEPWYKKLWFSVKGDFRTILISCITSLLTTVITILLSKYIK